MGLNTGLFRKILGLFAAGAMIICGSACFYEFSKHSSLGELRLGYSPDYPSVNLYFFNNYALVVFGAISLLFAIVEIFLLIPALDKYVAFAASGLMRAIFYVLFGVAILGVANDLGIAAGSLAIASGGVMLILEIASLF